MEFYATASIVPAKRAEDGDGDSQTSKKERRTCEVQSAGKPSDLQSPRVSDAPDLLALLTGRNDRGQSAAPTDSLLAANQNAKRVAQQAISRAKDAIRQAEGAVYNGVVEDGRYLYEDDVETLKAASDELMEAARRVAAAADMAMNVPIEHAEWFKPGWQK